MRSAATVAQHLNIRPLCATLVPEFDLTRCRVTWMTLAAALATATGCSGGSNATRATTAQQLVVATGRADTRIVTIAADGTGRRELTRHAPSGTDPAWVLAGRALTFEGPNDDLWLMRADGSHARRIASDFEFSRLSPEGRRVARLTNDGSLLVTTIAGHTLRRIRLRGTGDFENPPTWSPNGRFVALYSYTGADDDIARITTVDLAHGVVRTISPSRSYDTNPQWSPDGTRLAFNMSATLGRGALGVMNRDGTGRLRLAAGISPSVPVAEWSPDGRSLAFRRQPSTRSAIYVVGSTGGPERLVARTHARRDAETPVWSRDSRRLAFSSLTGIVVATIGGSARRVTPLGGGSTLSWAPGRRILFSDKDAIRSIDVNGRKPSTLSRVLDDVSPVWSPRGGRIAFVRGPFRRAAESTGAEVWVMGADGGGPRRIAAGFAPSWSPDGRQLAYSARVGLRTAVVVQTVGERARRVVAYGTVPTWSRTGSSIAFLANRNRDVHVVRADGTDDRVLLRGTQMRTEVASERYLFHPVWSPDGSALAVAATLEDSDGQGFGDYARVAELSGRTWTVGNSSERGLAWSPDGERLTGASSGGVWIARADGKGSVQIVAQGNDSVVFDGATWAPDGTRIAYTRCGLAMLACELETVRADGRARRRVVDVHRPAAMGDAAVGPDWRP
jgi:Tol biopolymer transport system component